MTDNLKSCQCGGAARRIFKGKLGVASHDAVQCGRCLIQTLYFSDYSMAVKIWNTRATDQITKNLAEALEVITKECLLQGMSENAGMDCWILQAQDAIKAYKETL